MATRSLLRFNNGVMIYRHWDGYPSNVLCDLKEMIERGVRTYDTEYFIGGLLQQIGYSHQSQKNKNFANREIYSEDDVKGMSNEMRNAVLGYGVFYATEDELSELDYGQEYSYILTDKEVKIMKWDFSRCLRKIKYDTLVDLSDSEIRDLVKRYE